MFKSNSYENYVKQSREMATLGSILAHLGWDQQVMLPIEGHAHRQEGHGEPSLQGVFLMVWIRTLRAVTGV